MNTKINKKRILLRGLYLLTGFLSLLAIGMAILSIPAVQNNLFKQLLIKVNKQTQCTIIHTDFSFGWTKGIDLMGIQIKDPENELVCTLKKVHLRINPLRLIWGKNRVIDAIELVEGQLNFIKEKGDTAFKIQLLLEKLSNTPSPSIGLSRQKKAWVINNLTLENCGVLVDDRQKEVLTMDFDPFHIQIKDIQVKLENFHYQPHKIMGTLQNFSAHDDAQRLLIKQLQTQFKVTLTATNLENLKIDTGNSRLQGDVQIMYEGLTRRSEAQEKLNILANVQHANLHAQDLAHFIPYFKDKITDYTIKGKIVGTLGDLYLKDFSLVFGKEQSSLSGTSIIKGLPDLTKTYFHAEIENSTLKSTDLIPHVSPTLHNTLQKIKFCNLKGTITGNIQNLTLQTEFLTDLGKIKTHLDTHLDTQSHLCTYQGTIATQDLNLGKLLDISKLEEVSMEAEINGQSFTPELMQVNLQANIQKLKWNTYTYANIKGIGQLSNKFFQGDIVLEDPNMKGELHTKIDFSLPQKEINLKGKLKNLAFHHLGLGEKPIYLRANLAIKLQHTSWDDWTTDTFLQDIEVKANGQQLSLDSLHLQQIKDTSGHLLTFNTDLFHLTAQGAIHYTALWNDLKLFIKNYQQLLVEDKQAQTAIYTKTPYQFSYQLNIKDINPLLSLLVKELYIAPGTTLIGSFSQAEQVKLEIHLPNLHLVKIGNYKLHDTEYHFTGLQDKNSKVVSARSVLSIKKQQIKPYLDTNNFNLTLNLENDVITFNHTIGTQASDWELQLDGNATLKNGTVDLKFDTTNLRLFERIWTLDSSSQIKIQKSGVSFDNFCLSNDIQQIKLRGKWFSKDTETLLLSFQHVLLENLPYFLSKKINGILDGKLSFTNMANKIGIDSDFHINTITINDLLIGDFTAKTNWQSHKSTIHLFGQLKHQKQPIIHIEGSYDILSNNQNIDLRATFSNAQLALLTPFVSEVFKELQGEINGQFHIKGPLHAPQLTGHGKLQNMALRFNYLHAAYKGHGTIQCSNNIIHINQLYLADDQAGEANFKGTLFHKNLQDFSLNLKGELHNLEIINTHYEDNETFYGKGIISGKLTLTGPIDNIHIHANAIVQKGTQLSIETRKYTEKAEQERYIHFVDLKKQKKANKRNTTVRLQGITLHLNLEITADAWADIIINKKDGDHVHARGKGFLSIKTDAEGNITISGTYELIEGTYTFSVYEIMKKKFKILPGSTITWIDQPYDAIVNIKAIYSQSVNLKPLLSYIPSHQTAVKEKTKEKTKYPINILLTLEGILSLPTLKFDIKFQELPTDALLLEAVTAFKEKIAMDKVYLKNQVFSLFVVKTFSASQGVDFDQKTLQSNMAEVFSQQISNLAGQVDKNLAVDIDLDMEGINQESMSKLPVKISYNLLDDRLNIARKSKINLGSDQSITLAELTGDWFIEYGVNKANNLKLKLHLYPASDQESGRLKSVFSALSFAYVKSFNRWKDLFTTKPTPTP